MYAEFRLRLCSDIEVENKSKEAETIKAMQFKMFDDPANFRNALHTLVSQNVTAMMESAFEQHKQDCDTIKKELEATIEKAKANKKPKSKTGDKDESTETPQT